MRENTAITADPAGQLALAQQDVAALLEQMRDAMKKEQEAAAARVQHLGGILQNKADHRVTLRSEIEQRWLKNIRQINGIYEEEDLPPKNADSYGSRVYVPLTRRLRNMAEARLADVLFPSDNRAWVLDPSPVAELADVASMLGKLPQDAPINVPGMPPGMQVSQVAKAVMDVQKEAELRATRMQRQIDDRLAECKWPAKARRAISDAIDLGTGVVKGPVATLVKQRVAQPDGNGGFSVAQVEKIVPAVEFVDLWNWYPDMSATSIEECIDILEAHHLDRKAVQALRDQPGFNAAAVDQVLASEPRTDYKSRRQDLRQIAGLSAAEDPRYTVWEYHGPIKGADLNACAAYERMHTSTMGPAADTPGVGGVTDGEPMEGQGYEADEGQPFDDAEDYPCVVWFCDGVVIKAILQPLESSGSRHIYSCLWWQRDKSSIFGYGLPDEVRDQQASANGSFRAMLDNMGLTVGPQIVIDQKIIRPVDGKWGMAPFKQWFKTDPTAKVSDAFGFYQIESRINELGSVFDKSKALMDEVATMPAFVAGTEQPSYMQSATGASLAYNASTLWVRRVVRHWDDDVIEPVMGRMVDWEMDYNEDPSIKGDFSPVAKGVTALVELEGQGQRMTAFVALTKQMGVPLRDQMRVLRQFARSLKLDPDEMLPTEEEIQNMPAQAPDPNVLRAETMERNSERIHEAKMATLSMKAAEIEGRADELARREKLALMELASRERMTLEDAARRYGYDVAKLNAEMADNEAARRHQAQMQNAEIAVKVAKGSGI